MCLWTHIPVVVLAMPLRLTGMDLPQGPTGRILSVVQSQSAALTHLFHVFHASDTLHYVRGPLLCVCVCASLCVCICLRLLVCVRARVGLPPSFYRTQMSLRVR
jgi:hypothetical protein